MTKLDKLAAFVIGFLLAGLLLYAARDADGATLTGSTTAVQSWVASVQSDTHVPGPAGPSIRIVVSPIPGQPGSCGGWVGGSTSTVFISTDPVCQTEEGLEHELGHAFSDRNLDQLERAWLVVAEGFPASTPWEPPSALRQRDLYCRSIACPNEVFADAYAGCALHLALTTAGGEPLRRGRSVAWWSGYGWVTSVARYADVCSAIRAFADPVGP